ncbi:DUF2591 domain-containing protein [Variovorax gossypii]
MKTSELTGALLDYWVARAEGYTDAGSGRRFPDHSVCVRQVSEDGPLCCLIYDSTRLAAHTPNDGFFQPSTDWAQGGPIVERERVAIWGGEREGWAAAHPSANPSGYNGDSHYIDVGDDDSYVGPTPLIAAMRAYVASKYGHELPAQSR